MDDRRRSLTKRQRFSASSRTPSAVASNATSITSDTPGASWERLPHCMAWRPTHGPSERTTVPSLVRELTPFPYADAGGGQEVA